MKHKRTYHGVDVWYDEDTNYWESSEGLRAKTYEELKVLIDDADPGNQQCIVIDGRIDISICEVVKIDDEEVTVKHVGVESTASREKHFKFTPKNKGILHKIMDAQNKITAMIEKLEKL